MKASPETCCVH